jgi:hypothetical protein
LPAFFDGCKNKISAEKNKSFLGADFSAVASQKNTGVNKAIFEFGMQRYTCGPNTHKQRAELPANLQTGVFSAPE